MFVPGINDLHYTDLLTELKLNPKCERYRAYLMTATFICGIFPLYKTLGGVTATCVPANSTTSDVFPFNVESMQITGSQTKFVDEMCAIKISTTFLEWVGRIMLLSGVAMLLWPAAWLEISCIRYDLHKFADCRDQYLKLIEQTKNGGQGTKDGGQKTKHKVLREISDTLDKISKTSQVFNTYKWRCNVLLLFQLVCFVSSMFTYGLTDYIKDPTLCVLNDQGGKSGMLLNTFACVMAQKKTIKGFLFVSILLSLCQMFAAGYGRWKTYVVSKYSSKKSIRMMAWFAKSCNFAESSPFVDWLEIDYLK